MANQIEKADAGGLVQYLNPDTLPRNPAFTQVVVATGPVKTVYIGMQNAVDAARNIIGKGDIKAQTVKSSRTCKPVWRRRAPSPSIL